MMRTPSDMERNILQVIEEAGVIRGSLLRRRARMYDMPAMLTAVQHLIEVAAGAPEETTGRLGREEGIFAGVSSGGACCAALAVDAQSEGATIVTIVCDRGDRYLSTGVFPD